MPQIEFHILSNTGADASMRHACQLVDQACQQQHAVFLRVESDAAAQHMDELLWTFRDQAFIPHEIISAQSPSHPRIMALIGKDEKLLAPFQSLLINLSSTLPVQLNDVQRIIEIVDTDLLHKQHARDRYKLYRDQGYQLETLNI
ncbi:MAG: DNA polymerase III subunit chi [Steroidobacteraceae bacterium]